MSEDEQRARFEAWYGKPQITGQRMKCNDRTSFFYINHTVEMMWQAWKESARQADSSDSVLTDVPQEL